MDSKFNMTEEELLFQCSDGLTDNEKEILEDELNHYGIEVQQCHDCGNWFNSMGNYVDSFDDYVCDSCVNDYVVCSHCNELAYLDDSVQDSTGNDYCPACADEVTVICDYCGDRVHSDYSYTDSEGNHACEHCYDYNLFICEECGAFVRADYAVEQGDCYYCPECAPEEIINSYNYTPYYVFNGYGDRYLGVELEVDNGGEDNHKAKEVLNYFGGDAYAKSDSSLDDGFEIVTHPSTLDYHMNNIDWRGALNSLKSLNYVSHDAGTCGLHVHMNRRGFGNSLEEQEAGIARVLYFFERHWDKIVDFSRRTYSQLDEWASRYLDDEEPPHPQRVLDYAKSDGSRYRCVNLNNDDTVEIRVFRGTLVYTSLMAALQFCELMFDIANLPLESVMDLTWNQFKQMGSRYKEFSDYIKTREL